MKHTLSMWSGEGVTINDIVTAIVSIAIQRHLTQHEQQRQETNENQKASSAASMMKGGKIHLHFPISHRPPSVTMGDLQRQGGSNRIVPGVLQIPFVTNETLAAASFPVDVVWQCRQRMGLYKSYPFVAALTWYIMTSSIALFPWRLLERLALQVILKPTGVLSNVRSPTEKASIAGYGIDNIIFYGTAHCQGLCVGILSYNQHLQLSVSMDNAVEADPHKFTACLESAYQELQEAIHNAPPGGWKPPEMTPWSARILEWTLPVLVAVSLGWIYGT